LRHSSHALLGAGALPWNVIAKAEVEIRTNVTAASRAQKFLYHTAGY